MMKRSKKVIKRKKKKKKNIRIKKRTKRKRKKMIKRNAKTLDYLYLIVLISRKIYHSLVSH